MNTPRTAVRNLVVTYHYVRPENSDGVTGVSPAEFREHLRLIKSRYRPVTAYEFAAYQREESGMALVTFDDALADQHDFAFPILEDEGVPAVFYAPMLPYSNNADRWCTQHLLHALADEMGWGALEKRLNPVVEPLLRDAGRRIDEAEMNRLYHYEEPFKRRLKYILAFALDHEQAHEALTSANKSVGLSPDDWYMSAAELLELQSAGHCLGGHGFKHVPFTTLTPKQQAAEMHKSQALMTQLFGAMARTLAYPFGRASRETEAIAIAAGYTHCFTTENRVDAKFLEQTIGAPAAAAA